MALSLEGLIPGTVLRSPADAEVDEAEEQVRRAQRLDDMFVVAPVADYRARMTEALVVMGVFDPA